MKMEADNCKYCDFNSDELSNSSQSIPNFELLVKECEAKEVEIQNKLEEEQTSVSDKDSIIRWLLINASRVELDPMQINDVVDTCKNYTDKDLVKFLHDHGVDIKTKKGKNVKQNALVFAARLGEPATIDWLFERGSGSDDYDIIVLKAILQAAKCGNLKNLTKLLNLYQLLYNIDSCTSFIVDKIFSMVAEKGYLEIIKNLHQFYYKNNNEACLRAFNCAIQYEHYHIAQWLIDNGLVINNQDDTRNNSINCAIINGKIEVIEWLINQGVRLFCNDKSRHSALHIAAKYGHLNVMKWLVKKGFDINNMDIVNLLVQHGHFECIKYLVHIGIDVFKSDRNGSTILHGACRYGDLDIVKFLVQHGANIHALDLFENNVLHVAVKHIEVVKYLVEKGCDVHLNNLNDDDLLYLACEHNSFEVVLWLIQENIVTFNSLVKHVNFFIGDGLEFLDFQYKLLEFVLSLLPEWNINALHDDVNTLLHNSVCNIGAVKLLLAHNANINALNKYGNTPLYSAFKEDEWEVAEYLLNTGADVDIKNERDETVLHCAVASEKVDGCEVSLLQQIVDLGADVNAKTVHGDSVLHSAVARGNFLHVKYLVNNGADICARNLDNCSVIEEAANHKEWQIVKYILSEVNAVINMKQFNHILRRALYFADLEFAQWLLERCPDHENITVRNYNLMHRCLSQTSDETVQFELIQLCLQYGADVNELDELGNCILYKCIHNYNLAKLLIEHSADVNIRNNRRETPLHNLLCCNNLYIDRDKNNYQKSRRLHNLSISNEIKFALDAKKYKIMCLLLRNGADPNMQRDNGKYYLHVAAMSENNYDIVRLLIQHGADVNARDNERNTFLHTMHFAESSIWLIEKYSHFVNIRNENGENVLHKAVACQDYKDSSQTEINSVQWIVNRSLQIKQNSQVNSKFLSKVLCDGYINSLHCLVSHINNINATDKKGYTALHHATLNGNMSAFKCLIHHNADINAVTNDGDSVLHIAVAKGNLDIVKFILSLNHPQLLSVKNYKSQTVRDVALASINNEFLQLIGE